MTFVGATGFVLAGFGIPSQCGPPRSTSAPPSRAPRTTAAAGTGWPRSRRPAGPAGVSQVRFYNTSDGWAFGPQLWATHDGGQHWTQIDTHGLRVTALEAGGQRVFAVWAQCSGTGPDFAADCTGSSLYSASPGSNQWAAVPGAGTGYSLSGTAGSAALVLSPSRGSARPGRDPAQRAGRQRRHPAAGHQHRHGHGQRLPSRHPAGRVRPQADGQPSSALLTGTTSSRLVLVCTSPPPGPPRVTGLTSADNGQRWQKAGTASCGHRDLGGGTAAGTIVLATTVACRCPPTAARPDRCPGRVPPGGFSYVRMTSATQVSQCPPTSRSTRCGSPSTAACAGTRRSLNPVPDS